MLEIGICVRMLLFDIFIFVLLKGGPSAHLSMLLIYLFSVNNLFGMSVCVCVVFFSNDFFLSLTRSFHLAPIQNHRSCSFAFSSWLNLLLFNFHTVTNKFSVHVRIHTNEIEGSKTFGLPSDFQKQWMLSLSAYYYLNLLSDQ